MDEVLGELLSVNTTQAFQFFFTGLKSTDGVRDQDDELLYVAGILAHYAQTSCLKEGSIACPKDLFDTRAFFTWEVVGNDAEILEIGGTQVILLAGFFRDQMARRHDVEWYDQFGRSLYTRASQHARDVRKREFFGRFAPNLPQWTITCSTLRKNLYESRYDHLLLKP